MFPTAVPAQGTGRRVEDEDFAVVSGRWERKPNGLYTDKFDHATAGWDIKTLSHPLHHFLRLRGAVRFTSVADVSLLLYGSGGGITPLDMSGATAYGMNEWGSGGTENASWQSWQDFSGNKGITLNRSEDTGHLQLNYTYEVECEIYRVDGNTTAMRSRMYNYGNDNDSMFTIMLAWFPHSIESIKRIALGYNASGQIHTKRFLCEYW